MASEDKDQSNAFEENETNIQPAYLQSKYHLTKSILLIELVKSDLRVVTE